MFDKLWILDKGGYMIYDGDPVEALVYFKTETSQANAAESECPSCGNVEADNILQIVEVKVIDSSGFPGKERQVSPSEWYEKYRKKMMPLFDSPPERREVPESNFRVPGKLDQVRTFIERNLMRKFSDRQYMIINLLEAPLLAFILGYISKYSMNGVYSFGDNKNYPVFIFMSIIVALFLGLTVSAEEIFRDRKILEREKFLNLSRLSYLLSKINFLFTLSAIQTLSFVAVANLILEVRGLPFGQWLVLFTTACFGNMLGLNISAGMRTAVSIYILIPLILVPQLLLGGAMIKFDDLHKSMSRKIYVPVIGDIMATRWAYEAISVEQFRNNKFNKAHFETNMARSQNDWYASFLIPSLRTTLTETLNDRDNEEYRPVVQKNLKKLNFHIRDLAVKAGLNEQAWMAKLNVNDFSPSVVAEARVYLDSLRTVFRLASSRLTHHNDSISLAIAGRIGESEYVLLKERYHNESLSDILLNNLNKSKIYDAGDRFIQKADPVYMPPGSRSGRAHFFAPYKQLGSFKISTLVFNLSVLWLMVFAMFVTLYYDLLKKLVKSLESLKLPFLRRKFGRHFQ
jgi:hypothetical protein